MGIDKRLERTRTDSCIKFYLNNNDVNRLCLCVSSGDPYVHVLSGKCSFMLRMPGNRSHDVVALAEDSTHGLLEEICQGLNCGSIYRVEKTSSPPNTTCFHHCLYQDGRLHNCSQSVGSNCVVITATCGKGCSYIIMAEKSSV